MKFYSKISRLAIVLLILISCSCRTNEEPPVPIADPMEFGIPQITDQLLDRKGFSLGYSFKYRQAIWVCYVLTAENLTGPQVGRSNEFRADPAVRVRPVKPEDYRGTGFDRGHLAPAADMTYSAVTMEQSFFMSNISPQVPGCNRGIWKRLESQVRRWAVKEGKVFVITGPIFGKEGGYMGKSDIPVPNAFYKVILDLTPPMKMIAFIVPNETSRKRIASFVVTVDEVETATGCDFFSELDDDLENELEKKSDISLWTSK